MRRNKSLLCILESKIIFFFKNKFVILPRFLILMPGSNAVLHMSRIDTLQAEPFLAVHMLCTEKRLCTNRVKFLLSMLSALLRYSFEPRRFAPHVKCKQRTKRVVAILHPTLGLQTSVKIE